MKISGRFFVCSRILALALAAAASAGGCVNLKVVAVDQKTQLENQVLGSFGELQKDLVLIQSVRGEGGEQRIPAPQREALQAMMNRQFNMDDVSELKAQGTAGEARTGLLQFIETDRTRGDPAYRAETLRLIEEENRDRTVFMKRVIAVNPNLGEKDYPAVQEMMHRLNADASAPGVMIQDDKGGWAAKPEPAKGAGK
jgi:hypothetical protein